MEESKFWTVNFGEHLDFPIFGIGKKSIRKINPMEELSMDMDGAEDDETSHSKTNQQSQANLFNWQRCLGQP